MPALPDGPCPGPPGPSADRGPTSLEAAGRGWGHGRRPRRPIFRVTHHPPLGAQRKNVRPTSRLLPSTPWGDCSAGANMPLRSSMAEVLSGLSSASSPPRPTSPGTVPPPHHRRLVWVVTTPAGGGSPGGLCRAAHQRRPRRARPGFRRSALADRELLPGSAGSPEAKLPATLHNTSRLGGLDLATRVSEKGRKLVTRHKRARLSVNEVLMAYEGAVPSAWDGRLGAGVCSGSLECQDGYTVAANK